MFYYVCVCVCVLALHTKWNVMLEVLLVSWRTMHTTSKCLLQVHRGLRDSLRLSGPANRSSQICCRWGLLSMCLLCRSIVGNNNDSDDDDDFRLSAWHFKTESVSPSPGFDSLVCGVISRALQQQKNTKNWAKKVFPPPSDILWGKKLQHIMSIRWGFVINVCDMIKGREPLMNPVSRCWTSWGKPVETWRGGGGGGLLHS